jgi:arsenate reductase|tara:strand:+ start:4710 stop:5054 length:345 start_codon:yes stop_codon:yes gene_type:complete
MIILYGLKNCDSCKKAKKWLALNKINYNYHDIRADGLNEVTLELWSNIVNLELLLNRRSTTWRNLPDADKNKINNENIIHYFLAYPTLIKRPIIKNNNLIFIGFNSDELKKKLN